MFLFYFLGSDRILSNPSNGSNQRIDHSRYTLPLPSSPPPPAHRRQNPGSHGASVRARVCLCTCSYFTWTQKKNDPRFVCVCVCVIRTHTHTGEPVRQVIELYSRVGVESAGWRRGAQEPSQEMRASEKSRDKKLSQGGFSSTRTEARCI